MRPAPISFKLAPSLHVLARIKSLIYEIRGVKVMLDKDLADLYHVTTGNLNKAVKRVPSDERSPFI
ncbi:MAG: ORF6N domain-containing protein [Prevotella sp.]|nr:ORF6N domain-containing protein [Prevotella sp.]